jgi:hypothetical protein
VVTTIIPRLCRVGVSVASVILAIALTGLAPAVALAAVPSNDNFSSALVVGALPFSDALDTTSATSESGEPFPSCLAITAGTVWYSFTPTEAINVTAKAGGNGFFLALGAYTGASLAALSEVSCGIASIDIEAAAGATYYIQVIGQLSTTEFEMDVAPVPTQPDGRIRRLGDTIKGDNIYNTDAGQQSINANVPAGKSIRMVIQVQNDSSIPASFRIGANSPELDGFEVVYVRGWPPVDISAAIRSESLTTPTIAPGDFWRFRVKVTVHPIPYRGASPITYARLTFQSVGTPSRIDAVAFRVTRN